MNALLIVCPHCKARYQVPNANANGKTVACKKCGQQFTAKVMRAAPKQAPAAAAPKPQSPPPANDPFGDLFSSEGADSAGPLGASPLAAMPRKKNASKPFPWMIVAIGGGAVAMLAVLVFVVIAAVWTLGSSGPRARSGLSGAQQANSKASQAAAKKAADEAYAQHSKILDEEFEIVNEFVSACEALQSQDGVPAFLERIRAATQRLRNLAEQVNQLPPISDEQNAKISKPAKERMASLEARIRASGQNLAKFRTPEMLQVMLEFQSAGIELNQAVNAAMARRKATGAGGNRPAPGTNPGGSSQGVDSQADAPLPPGISAMGAQNYRDFRSRVGAENMVMFEAPSFSHEQIDEIKRRLEGVIDKNGYSSWSGSGQQYAVLLLGYSGDLQQLADQIDFGEVGEVVAEHRIIRLKSLSIPE